ncbi:MAG: ATP-binding protein [Solirubrobacterales bacterium]
MATNSPKATAYRRRLIDALFDELLTELPGVMVVGPRASGKTTTLSRRAQTIVNLDAKAQAAAFEADPDAALRALKEPVLLDEWQAVPGVYGAARRAIDEDESPNRFYLTGSVLAGDQKVHPGTGRVQPFEMYPMTVREQIGNLAGPTLFDRLADGEPIPTPKDPPDLRAYVELALRGGFPMAALHLSGRARQAWLEGYVRNLLTHDVEQLEDEQAKKGPKRDREQLRKYFEACCLNSAGVIAHKRIYDAVPVAKATGEAYERLLTRLLVIEEVPGWTSNRFKRLVHQRKRYMIDASLLGAVLRLDEAGVMSDSDLLGRTIDTFVAAQLRPEVPLSSTRPRLYHLRTEGGRQEIDLLAELAGEMLIAIEVKAGAAPNEREAKHLEWLHDAVGTRFVAGVVFHTGPQIYPLGDRIVAAPIASIWS